MLGAGSPQTAVRRLTEGAADALDRLSGISLESGNVNLIALDAIATAFGQRWDIKRDQVYEHVDRVLERALSDGDFCLRVSPTDFLVVQPNGTAFAAQALAYRCFKEIWTHFLGKTRQPAVAVHRVTALSAQEITAVEVDPKVAFAGEEREIAAVEAERRALGTKSASQLSPLKWAPFVASNGRRVDVICRPEPVFSVKNQARIAVRLTPTVVDVETGEALRASDINALNRSDLFRIYMCTLSRGLEVMQGGSGPELSLVVPASYIVLSHPSSRQTFIRALSELHAVVKTGVILEIRDLVGVPHAALEEMVLTLRSKCLLIVAHLSAGKPSRFLKDAGFHAVSVSCPKSLDGDAAFIGWLQGWMKSAQVIARSIMVYGCSTPNRIRVASALGATHYSNRSRQIRPVVPPIADDRPSPRALGTQGLSP